MNRRFSTARAVACLIVLNVVLIQRASSLSSSSTERSKYASHLKTKIASSVAKTERREKERASSSRPMCDRCSRPPVLCICESLPSKLISTSTDVLILQHPREFRRKSLSTVPLMPLVLEKCTIKRGYNFEPEDLELVQDYLALGRKPLVLFPGENAISLDKCTDEHEGRDDDEMESLSSIQKEKQLLILIDGTWAEARRMIMQSKRLMAECQQIQFTAENESIYDVVRKEPEKHCVSTLEACGQALVLLEPNNECATEAKNALEHTMQYMVDTKRNVSLERNPEPRFTRPGAKTFEKNKRRYQIKEELFSGNNENS